MHTLLVLAGGFALLGVCLLAAKFTGGSSAAMVKGAFVFLPLWLIGAAINMWFGVAKAGYSIKEELPIFLVIFAVPAAAALVFVWQCRAR
ncbi:MAG TPA: hypothetical protein VFB63_08765 [Bryobacteraceae bacterium]|nr:hypothetical protein [Bryobacteraceae bacterium]